MESGREKAFSPFALWLLAFSPSSCLEHRHEAQRFGSHIVTMRHQCEFKASLLRIVKRKTERARAPGGIYKPLCQPLTAHPRLVVV